MKIFPTKQGLSLWGKGMAMGVADLIPGVSGGTIALVTGIYDELLEALNSLKGPFKQVRLKFLLCLLGGILTAVGAMVRPVGYLLENHPTATFSFFLGLVLVSTLVVAKGLPSGGWGSKALVGPLGFALTFWVVGGGVGNYPDSYWFLYLCGVLAMMAMLLPGISGSLVLLLLGKYEVILGALKAPFLKENFFFLLVFGLGLVSSLLIFPRFLTFLLSRFQLLTMTFLVGVLAGSLRRLWPWQGVSRDGGFFLSIVTFLIGGGVIFLFETLKRRGYSAGGHK